MTDEDKVIRRNRGKGFWSRVEDKDAFEKTIERIKRNEELKRKKLEKVKKRAE